MYGFIHIYRTIIKGKKKSFFTELDGIRLYKTGFWCYDIWDEI